MRRNDIAAMLRRTRRAVATGQVHVTAYAADRAAAELAWDHADILAVIEDLVASDFHRAEPSVVWPDELLWVFCPEFVEFSLWIELVERGHVIVVSCHER